MNIRWIQVLLASLSLSLIPSCGKDDGHGHAPGSGHGKTAGDTGEQGAGGHGALVSLGSIDLGGHTVEVSQGGSVEAGKEVGVDLMFAEGKALPATVRAWIGGESAVGSLKARLAKEGDHGMHGHVEVPSPLPDGSRIWFEVEGPAGASRSSIAFRE